MATLKQKKTKLGKKNGGGVPAELYDYDAPVWWNAADYSAWCSEHLGEQPKLTGGDTRWHSRYRHALTAWGIRNGLEDPRWEGQLSYRRLEELGLHHHIRSLDRARRGAGPIIDGEMTPGFPDSVVVDVHQPTPPQTRPNTR